LIGDGKTCSGDLGDEWPVAGVTGRFELDNAELMVQGNRISNFFVTEHLQIVWCSPHPSRCPPSLIVSGIGRDV
jgi:hypothetical protein